MYLGPIWEVHLYIMYIGLVIYHQNRFFNANPTVGSVS